jgi:hypothetical protein
MPARPAPAKRLAAKDIVHEVGDDPAYLAVVDLATYAKDLPDWDYCSLTAKIAKDMSAGKVVAWGCPDGPVRVRLTTRKPTRRQMRSTSRRS